MSAADPSRTFGISRRRARVGAVILLACVQYPIAEAIAAAAWRTPPYSYARNYISDLGVQSCTSRACSPLADVMNTGFILAGLLCIAAALVLAPLVAGRVWRGIVVALAITHGLGTMVVGIVHSTPGTVGGSPHAHVVGAYMAILGGNLALLALGAATRRSGAPATFSGFSIILGLCGVTGAMALVGSRLLPPGVFERIAADPMTIWEMATGLILLICLRRCELQTVTVPDLRR